MRTIHRGARCAVLAALVLALVVGAARAQNASNYHVLTNGGDAIFAGVGAGGAQQPVDGLMTFVAGEDLRGSHRLRWSGDFGYRQVGFVEQACVMGGVIVDPVLKVKFPMGLFIELDGLNGNAPPVFTNPACTLPSFPLGTSGFVPYGVGPGSSVSFLWEVFPSVAGVPSGLAALGVLLPNNGLVASGAGAGGQATLIAEWSAALPISSTGLCWQVQFIWVPSALGSLDDIDGWVHWVTDSPDSNQYWLFSDDEQNLWQSQSVASDAGHTALQAFFANDDYALAFVDADPVTLATLAPRAGTTPFSAFTANVSDEYGVVLNPNGGFDVGRGSSAISLAGHAGVANPVTGVGNQDPTLGPGVVPTLGFATWDNGGDHNGSVRVTWVCIDTPGLLGNNPASDAGVVKQGGKLRLPVLASGFVQPFTSQALGFFGHVTRPGFVTPFPSFDHPFVIGGASWQMPTAGAGVPSPCLLGAAVNLTYGTSGRAGSLGAPGKLTFDPHVADVSGSRQIFLFD